MTNNKVSEDVFDKYMSFDFSEKAGGVTVGNFTLGYLPDGYTLPDCSAYSFTPNDPEMDCIVIMGNDDVSITLRSTISINELIKIAKKIK